MYTVGKYIFICTHIEKQIE